MLAMAMNCRSSRFLFLLTANPQASIGKATTDY
jgi:hypothetical protein